MSCLRRSFARSARPSQRRGVGVLARCAATKHDGTPCERIVGASQTYCYSHDASRSEARSRAASKAASSKHQGTELAQIKVRLKEIVEGVLDGSIAPGRAAVACQAYNNILRTVDRELKVREQEELIPRLEELEATLDRTRHREGRTWYGA
jgi:hypothetical protein